MHQSQEIINTTAIAELHDVKREFRTQDNVVYALRGIDATVQQGEFIALQGRSGSGKTTLLNILVGLDSPTSGEVLVLGHSLAAMSEDKRAKMRLASIGIMFQNAHLFPSLTAQENVEVPLRLARVPSNQRIKQAQEALEMVGLHKRAQHRGLELSGGEQQRVALARALVHKPRFIVADEPTGNLDTLTSRNVIDLLRTITHESKIGMLVATHDPVIIATADRVLKISDGKIL